MMGGLSVPPEQGEGAKNRLLAQAQMAQEGTEASRNRATQLSIQGQKNIVEGFDRAAQFVSQRKERELAIDLQKSNQEFEEGMEIIRHNRDLELANNDILQYNNYVKMLADRDDAKQIHDTWLSVLRIKMFTGASDQFQTDIEADVTRAAQLDDITAGFDADKKLVEERKNQARLGLGIAVEREPLEGGIRTLVPLEGWEATFPWESALVPLKPHVGKETTLIDAREANNRVAGLLTKGVQSMGLRKIPMAIQSAEPWDGAVLGRAAQYWDYNEYTGLRAILDTTIESLKERRGTLKLDSIEYQGITNILDATSKRLEALERLKQDDRPAEAPFKTLGAKITHFSTVYGGDTDGLVVKWMKEHFPNDRKGQTNYMRGLIKGTIPMDEIILELFGEKGLSPEARAIAERRINLTQRLFFEDENVSGVNSWGGAQ